MLRKAILGVNICFFALTSFGFSAEKGGMPQLDPEFWISQIFWLIITFGFVLIVLSKFILPNISNNLETRKSQILENIESAEKQRIESENKIKDFKKIISDSKLEAKNIIVDAKKKVNEEIDKKREILQNEINKEINSAEEEINNLIKKSPEKINQIAIETSSDLIHELIGTEVNKSSISAIVKDLSKKERNHGI